MKFNFNEFVDVMSFEVSWFEANTLWVIISLLIYLTLLGLFLNAIRMSIKFEKIHKKDREKTYGRFSKDVLMIGLTIALIILSIGIIQRLSF